MVRDFKLVADYCPQTRFYFYQQKNNFYFKDILKGRIDVKEYRYGSKYWIEASYTKIDLTARVRILWYTSAFLLLTACVALLTHLSVTLFHWSLYCGLTILLLSALLNSPIIFYWAAGIGLKKLGYKGKLRLRY